MGFTEVLTGILILLKLCDRIHISWFLVFLPEMISFVFYVVLVICSIVVKVRADREIEKLFDELRMEEKNNGK